jgi:hypothetical protein
MNLSYLLLAAAEFDPLGIIVLLGGLGAAGLLYICSQREPGSKKKSKVFDGAKTSSAGHSPVAQIVQKDVELIGVDKKTAALLIAIVCDTAGGEPERLKFVSIKAL